LSFFFDGTGFRLGALHPEESQIQELMHQLGEREKAHGGLYKISEQSFAFAWKLYETLPKIYPVQKGINVTEGELAQFQSRLQTYQDIQILLQDASMTDILTILLSAALKFNTSDVHIEAEQKDIIVRYRIDGLLQEIASLPKESWKKIISRIKLISGLKINRTDIPQDGRFTIFMKEGDTDVRVSTIPTAFGESVVMRLLQSSAIQVEFSDLGYRPIIEKKLLHEMEKPHGMILTTGPTGSGKTTTLYAILKKLNTQERKIITLEDPIEYKLKGINQSQIDSEKEYTFANGLRSLLRQDPDIIMVGEIRDAETADIAINAALTGHLLLSTIHTNSAAGTIPRLIAMGTKPFLLAPALNTMMGQRLIRRICKNCREPYTPDVTHLQIVEEQLQKISPASGEIIPDISKVTFFHGKGCPVCHQTGYKGRVGIYEIIIMNDALRAALSQDLSEYEVKRLAIEQGMITMTQDGFLKVIDGITTVEEVLKATGGE
jgi:type II secretory ATPase GspE/PulE/Tfp pilus assembly ATPase PilB-like protein